ncbi:hypothetical protein CMI47_20975 [Candidatus Pacearchaeota archaeon]|nr:hypothetical protein [Candidatus Pacearchaeota archaeon]|tara:strand:+ start:355 stop:678 length:324 start_codon:yes stop_codon:yes gene_type:complete
MAQEYVKISPDELKYGEKNLLQSQVEILESAKVSKAYKKLRKSEFMLKLELKKHLITLKESLKEVDRVLPQSHMHQEQSEDTTFETSSINTELEKIKSKLDNLQNIP